MKVIFSSVKLLLIKVNWGGVGSGSLDDAAMERLINDSGIKS